MVARVAVKVVGLLVRIDRWMVRKMSALGPMSRDNSPQEDAGLLAVDPYVPPAPRLRVVK